jgi:hypothetical protein
MSRLVVRSSLGAKATLDVAVVENGLVVTVGPIDLVQGLIDQECARRSPLGRPATTRRSLGGRARETAVADQIDVVGQWRVHLGTSPTGRFQSWDYETRIESTAACVPRGRARRPCHRASRNTVAGRDEAGQAEGGRGLKRTDDATAIEASLAENAEGKKANYSKSEISALTSVPESSSAGRFVL